LVKEQIFGKGSGEMSEAILGIDVSKKKLDVALIAGERTLSKKFDNSPKGFALLIGWLRSLRIELVHACMESTGGYGDAIAEFLYAKGHYVSVVNPFRIKAFANSDLQRNKTDPADARTIADFCRVKQPRLWQPPSPEVKQLQVLTRRIEALEQMLIMEQNRSENADTDVRLSIERMVETLKAEIRSLEKLIKKHIDDHPDLKQQRDLLETIPGIGRKTSQILLGELEFRQFSSARAVAAHAGVTPRKDQSGTSLNRTRLSKLGSSRIRKALFLPAMVAVKHNAIIRGFANSLRSRGKKPKQVICAAMRKLLHLAFGVIKTNRPFDSNLVAKA
jgi:transposase